MSNMFSLVLTITTFITGIFWFLDRFKFASARRRSEKQSAYQQRTDVGAISNGDHYAIEIIDKKKWIETCASIFPLQLLVLVFRSFIFEPFQIPSGSMMPTLLVGDFILVNKFAYSLKDPITQRVLIKTGHPKRGDVVVFKYPPDPNIDYIKRVVGLPGDRVSYDPLRKRVTLKPGCVSKEDCAAILPVTYSEFTPSNFVQTFHLIDHQKIISYFLQIQPDKKVKDGIRLVQRKESLNNDVTYNVLTLPEQKNQLGINYQKPVINLTTEWIVPQGEYFVMGDNRDNSADSRYWGFVPERNLVGKATTIWMSFNKQEGQWPTGIRLDRIGKIN